MKNAEDARATEVTQKYPAMTTVAVPFPTLLLAEVLKFKIT